MTCPARWYSREAAVDVTYRWVELASGAPGRPVKAPARRACDAKHGCQRMFSSCDVSCEKGCNEGRLKNINCAAGVKEKEKHVGFRTNLSSWYGTSSVELYIF